MTSTSPTAPSNTSRAISLLVVALGSLIMVGAVFADSVGLSGGGDGFGWKQLIAAIVGLVVLLAGVAAFLRPMLTDDIEETLE